MQTKLEEQRNQPKSNYNVSLTSAEDQWKMKQFQNIDSKVAQAVKDPTKLESAPKPQLQRAKTEKENRSKVNVIQNSGTQIVHTKP